MFTRFRKSLATRIAPELKFTPASAEVNWQRIETLVHGPGASDYGGNSFNSAVFACLAAIATAYPEPPLTVYRKLQAGKIETLPEHPLQELLDKPTPNNELTVDEIRFWLAWAKHIDGNAYLIKVRSGNERTGNVVELWPVSPTRIAPYTIKDSSDWISYYKYQIRPGQTVNIPVENVIHFKMGLDDHDMRKGLSRLKALVREICTDEEADKFSAALLKNYAIPGLVVWPTNGGNMTEDDAERITAKLRQKLGGDNRGNIAVMSKESKAEQFGFSPEQLNLTALHRIPEERISAVMGVPAIIAGLGAGLDRATYSNARELREMFTEMKLVPEWQMDGRRLDGALRADFTSDKNIYIAHDLTNVRALQEDEDAKYTRLSVATGRKPFMTVNEARADIGLDPLAGEDELSKPVPSVFQQNPNEEEEPAAEPPDEDTEKLFSDLQRWQKKALKAYAANDRGRLLEDFALSVIPQDTRLLIMEALEEARSESDIKRIFEYRNGHG